MKKFLLLLFLVAAPLHGEPPALVVLIIGDQVRIDYFDRWASVLTPQGLRRFQQQGVFFANARIPYAQTVTAPGHVLFGSGLTPSQSGIVGNRWYDRQQNNIILGSEIRGGQERVHLPHFHGISLAQRWRHIWPKSRAISVSFKDRGSVLFTGPGQNEAFWWEREEVGFRTYGTPPAWLEGFNRTHQTFEKRHYKNASDTDDWVASLAEHIVNRYELGQAGPNGPDLLAISFSAMDMVGHRYGPDHPRTKEAFRRLDQAVARLMAAVESMHGGNSSHILWAFSSDHGVTPSPRFRDRMSFRTKSLPFAEKIAMATAPFIYLKSPTPEEAAPLQAALMARPQVAAVYTRWQIEAGDAPPAIQAGYFQERCGELWVVLKPGMIFSDYPQGTTHGQPTDDDARVPLAFYGNGVSPALRDDPVSPGNAAATILKRLGQRAPGLPEPLSL